MNIFYLKFQIPAPLLNSPPVSYPTVNYHLPKLPPGQFPPPFLVNSYLIKFPNPNLNPTPNPDPDPGGNSPRVNLPGGIWPGGNSPGRNSPGGNWPGGNFLDTSEDMQQIYWRTPMPKCGFNKVAKQLYWNHTSAWVFSCKFAAYFQNTFS